MYKDYSKEIPEEWLRVSKVFECLGDEQRQRILLSFEPGEELCAKDIVDVSTIKRTSVVHHLKKMEEAGVLLSRKDGKYFYYRLNPETVISTLESTLNYVKKHL